MAGKRVDDAEDESGILRKVEEGPDARVNRVGGEG